MPAPAQVAIDPSQFPDAVRFDLFESLRTRKVNHKFHYDSYKQTQKWLALHQAYSPAVTDPHCNVIYEQSFLSVIERLKPGRVHLVGLGCGGGRKDAALLQLLRSRHFSTWYQPCDVSLAMVLVARQTALESITPPDCSPVVCDLATTRDLASLFVASHDQKSPSRIFTFFGMLPNFEPKAILPRLAKLLVPGDHLLLSANLAPGSDYAKGVEQVLPLYDNALTRDWLITFLADLGVDTRQDGQLVFGIDEQPEAPRLRRIVARFHFVRDRMVEVHGERFLFQAGEAIQLFFSYRHTPALVEAIIKPHGLLLIDQWVTPSGEEGVFLITRPDKA